MRQRRGEEARRKVGGGSRGEHEAQGQGGRGGTRREGGRPIGDHTLLRHRNRRGGAKWNRGDDGGTVEAENLDEKLSKFQYSPHSLRLPASSVAALCGMHPFQNIPELLFDFVYQSYLGKLLLQQDAKALGLTLVDAKTHEQETMLNLASAASKETKELVKQVLEVSEGKRKLQSVEDVQSIQKKIKSQAAKAQESGKLSKRQVESLVEASRSHVSTGFGTCHEDEALDVYEKQIGCHVRERNEALMEWRFQRVNDCCNELGVTAVPMGEAKRRSWDPSNEQVLNAKADEEPVKSEEEDGTASKPIEIDDDDNADHVGLKNSNSDVTEVNGKEAESVACSSSVVTSIENRPFFRIVGAVDGIRDELFVNSSKPPAPTTESSIPPANHSSTTPSNLPANVHNPKNENKQLNSSDDEYCFPDDDDQWTLRPIIVECKHRMAAAKVPPPLYDQIQTCLYCHMYNVEEADLIQVVRKKVKYEEKENAPIKNNEGTEDGDSCKNKMKKTRAKKEAMKITVSRISLNDPIHNHNYHWKETLLPRLASFVDAVYSLRKDDGRRYRLLMALSQSQDENSNDTAEEEAWKTLWEECPWIKHCDTSFGKRRIY